MSSPAHQESIDWNALHHQGIALVRFLASIDRQQIRIDEMEEHIRTLTNGLAEAIGRLTDQNALIRNLERDLRLARKQLEEADEAINERLTEVLERDYHNDNPRAATAANLSRDEALEDMEALIGSLWGVIAQEAAMQQNQDTIMSIHTLAEVVWMLFGGSDVNDGALAELLGDQHTAQIARKARAIRQRLAACAPTHSWDFAFIPDEALNPDQEAWHDCPRDGLAHSVVQPAYLEDGRIIKKQVVYTVEPDASTLPRRSKHRDDRRRRTPLSGQG